MRRKLGKLHKHSLRFIIIAAVLAVLAAAAAGFTLAAYTSRSYVKGTAASPKQVLYLSSDYLSTIASTAEAGDYPVRVILIEAGNETEQTEIEFYIDNRHGGTISAGRMTYSLHIGNLAEGIIVRTEGRDITAAVLSEAGYTPDTMPANTLTTHKYKITIPPELINELEPITVTAVPDSDSDSSGNMLAAKIKTSLTGKVAVFSVRGELIDRTNSNAPYDFAAFNYSMSVVNAAGDHTMTLNWDTAKVEIDPLFLRNELGLSGSEIDAAQTEGTVSFTMNPENDNYLAVFYRVEGRSTTSAWQASWEAMEAGNVITFAEAAE